MKKILTILLVFSFHYLVSNTLQAQERFDASLMAGMNMCQIDGDVAGGFNHIGLRAGVGASFAIGNNDGLRGIVELAYTQKGSFISDYNRRLSADYVEVAMMLGYDMLDSRLRIALGVAPGVLVRANVTNNGSYDQASSDNFKPVDWLPAVFSIRYLLTNHIGIELRGQNSLLSVTKENATGTYRIFRSNTGAFNRLITIGLGYKF